jgi:hypothetical protein
MSNYKRDHPDESKSKITLNCLGARKAESDKIREKYPDRIPVICEKSATSKLPDIDKSK